MLAAASRPEHANDSSWARRQVRDAALGSVQFVLRRAARGLDAM